LGGMKERVFPRIFASLWAMAIILATLMRGAEVGKYLRTSGWLHLAVHLFVFCVLGILVQFSFRRPSWWMIAVFSCLLLGFWSEGYEHLVFGSSMEYMDVMVDTVGVILGVSWGYAFRGSSRRRARLR